MFALLLKEVTFIFRFKTDPVLAEDKKINVKTLLHFHDHAYCKLVPNLDSLYHFCEDSLVSLSCSNTLTKRHFVEVNARNQIEDAPCLSRSSTWQHMSFDHGKTCALTT